MKTSTSYLQHGLSLVELMVAMTIGLILMLGATGVLITNQRAFSATEGLSGIQESGRIAVDMLSRDLREAGGHPCLTMSLFDQTSGNANAVAFRTQLEQNSGVLLNVDNGPDNMTGQGALQLVTVNDTQSITAQAGTTLTVPNALAAGDIIIACTGKAAYLLEVSAANAASITVSSAPATNLTGATVAMGLNFRLWYIGSNADGRIDSLYRQVGNAGPEEMVDNVVSLIPSDLGNGAIRIELTLCGRSLDDLAAQDGLCGGRITRTTTALVQRRTA